MFIKVQNLYSTVSNHPEGLDFMDIKLVENAFTTTYSDHLKDITQLTGNPRFIDSWMDNSIMYKYYQTLETTLRERPAPSPPRGASTETIDAAAAYHIIELAQLSKAADRVGWLQIIDEPLAIRYPLPCTEFLRDFSTHLSKKVNIITKVSVWWMKLHQI